MTKTYDPTSGNQPVTGALTAVGASEATELRGGFGFHVWGTFTGAIELQRRHKSDTDDAWTPVSKDTAGTSASYTAPVNTSGYEPADGWLYRAEVTAISSGTINYRIS